MIRAVLDTNVLVSGLVRRHPEAPPALIVEAWHAGVFELAVSSHIIAEVERTLQDRYFRRRVSPEQAARFVEVLTIDATQTEVVGPVETAASHVEDDYILATAVSAEADYLVTGDQDLQNLGSYRDIAIVSPRQFLGVLAQEVDDQQPQR